MELAPAPLLTWLPEAVVPCFSCGGVSSCVGSAGAGLPADPAKT